MSSENQSSEVYTTGEESKETHHSDSEDEELSDEEIESKNDWSIGSGSKGDTNIEEEEENHLEKPRQRWPYGILALVAAATAAVLHMSDAAVSSSCDTSPWLDSRAELVSTCRTRAVSSSTRRSEEHFSLCRSC